MMIRTAGGPPMVSPLDYGERREPRFKRSTWLAIGVVSAAHIGLGAALYAQRFELEAPEPVTPGPVTVVDLFKPPKLAPPEPAREVPPQPPTTRTNPLPVPPTTPDVITIASGDLAADSTSITTTTVVSDPTPDAAPAAAAETAPPLITSPKWLRQPTGEQLARAYPERALAAEISGSARLNCRVEVTGRVSDCAVVSETPRDQGFGRAALGLTRYFQLIPRTVDGAAEGSRVNIGLRFAPPAD